MIRVVRKVACCLAPLLLLVGLARGQVSSSCPDAARAMRCISTAGNPPTLDGDLSDWGDVLESMSTDLRSIFGTTYETTNASPPTFRCLYDTEKIYFAFDIPGEYRFDTEDNHLCAAIGTMFKIGPSATFYNMGGCNQVFGGCATAVPEVCADYTVDLGAHWELRTTQQRVLYTMNDGSGDDVVGNKDDEYSVSPFCRFDDDDAQAGNEWEGAWSHTAASQEMGAPGSYIFELSRTLTTASSLSDAQLQVGGTYSFGIAFWDPFEREEGGWTDAGHYMTGCGAEWIDLTLDATAQRQVSPPVDQSFLTPSVSSPISLPFASPITVPPPSDVVFIPTVPAPSFDTSTAAPLITPPETANVCSVPESLTCEPVSSVPELDGQLDEWMSVSGLESEIHSIFGGTYDAGAVSYKCQFDSEKIYFALEIPGLYRFNTTDNHFCAAIGTMFKLGSRASYINMGGCPDALAGCPDGVPPACNDYRVDLGAHWELRTTEQGVLYPMNDRTGSGNDLVANNDDEYGVSAFCRFDDDDYLAANEWEGAWSHSNSVDGELGLYRFEIARTLSTLSDITDTQLAAGETYSFGIAYWDPYETEEGGWSDAGHFLTGCAAEWIDLVLGGPSTSTTPEQDANNAVDETPVVAQASCSAATSLTCEPTGATIPTLDGTLDDWVSIPGLASDIVSIFGTTYDMGAVSYKCQYDAEKIYFALEIPGLYRFNTTDNHFCAAIGTMFKIGSRAAYINMGGCPDTLAGCPDGVPPECDDYLVDLGAHWELRTTEQGVLYPINNATGSGNDLVANNDDEYGVGSFCRFDDDDSVAANDWEGAWSHTNPIEGAVGTYQFEIARTLRTASTYSDAQFTAGSTYSFGIAYWDPFETDDSGWTDAGHYLTGCASNWIDLTLGPTASSGGTGASSLASPSEEEASSMSSDSSNSSGWSMTGVWLGLCSLWWSLMA